MTGPLRVILAHNFYREPGGEDVVFRAEEALLSEAGHEVWTFTVDNADLDERSAVRTACNTVWNRGTARRLGDMVRSMGADVVHFHNTFPLMSPSCHGAARSAGAAVVQTLHNYRLYCPAGTFLRSGEPCERCADTSWPWPSIRFGCYRGSRSASAATAAMLVVHRVLGTWHKDVDMFLALSEHGRRRFEGLGLSRERLRTKPNFVAPDPGPGSGEGEFVLFAGRLTEEKGVRTLLEAAEQIGGSLRWKIMGQGPLEHLVRDVTMKNQGLSWRGGRPHSEVLGEMGRALVVVVPSIWEEPFGRTVIEAFATGTPVIASRCGALPELVTDKVDGFLVPPGDAPAIVEAIRSLQSRPDRAAAMRVAARRTFEARFTQARNVKLLLGAYAEAIARRRAHPPVSDESPPVRGTVA